MPTSSECIATFHGKMAKCSLKKGKTAKKNRMNSKQALIFVCKRAFPTSGAHTPHTDTMQIGDRDGKKKQ